jgi:hypothetical protein
MRLKIENLTILKLFLKFENLTIEVEKYRNPLKAEGVSIFI